MFTASFNDATPGLDSEDSFDNNHVSHVKRDFFFFFIAYANACCKLFLKSCDKDST